MGSEGGGGGQKWHFGTVCCYLQQSPNERFTQNLRKIFVTFHWNYCWSESEILTVWDLNSQVKLFLDTSLLNCLQKLFSLWQKLGCKAFRLPIFGMVYRVLFWLWQKKNKQKPKFDFNNQVWWIFPKMQKYLQKLPIFNRFPHISIVKSRISFIEYLRQNFYGTLIAFKKYTFLFYNPKFHGQTMLKYHVLTKSVGSLASLEIQKYQAKNLRLTKTFKKLKKSFAMILFLGEGRWVLVFIAFYYYFKDDSEEGTTMDRFIKNVYSTEIKKRKSTVNFSYFYKWLYVIILPLIYCVFFKSLNPKHAGKNVI